MKLRVRDEKAVNISICDRDSYMSWDHFEYLLQSIGDRGTGRVVQITLEGTEPLEHPQFLEMIKKIDTLGWITNIKTNAVHLDLSLVQELESVKGLGFVIVSVENPDELPMDKIELMKLAGIKVKIQTILTLL